MIVPVEKVTGVAAAASTVPMFCMAGPIKGWDSRELLPLLEDIVQRGHDGVLIGVFAHLADLMPRLLGVTLRPSKTLDMSFTIGRHPLGIFLSSAVAYLWLSMRSSQM
jgi:hypothetical protein